MQFWTASNFMLFFMLWINLFLLWWCQLDLWQNIVYNIFSFLVINIQISNFSLFYFCISQYIFKAWWSGGKRIGSDDKIDALESNFSLFYFCINYMPTLVLWNILTQTIKTFRKIHLKTYFAIEYHLMRLV